MNNLELLADALTYMEENLCETITAEAAARNCFCSKSCLEKLFRSVYGYGIKEYVIKRRMTKAAEDDIVFRIGGDEFALLTNSRDISYARKLAELITGRNGEAICFEGREIPLSLYAAVTRFEGKHLKYDELFVQLHQSILESK